MRIQKEKKERNKKKKEERKKKKKKKGIKVGQSRMSPFFFNEMIRKQNESERNEKKVEKNKSIDMIEKYFGQ